MKYAPAARPRPNTAQSRHAMLHQNGIPLAARLSKLRDADWPLLHNEYARAPIPVTTRDTETALRPNSSPMWAAQTHAHGFRQLKIVQKKGNALLATRLRSWSSP